MKKIFLSLFVAAVSTGAFAQGEARFRKIDSLMNHFYTHDKFMGAVTIREKDKVVFEEAYGFADVEKKIPATPDTKYKIGSITKMFTSSIIFQLIEEKKLSLDTKLSKYYPQVKNADKITIAQLLGHQSGIFNFTSAPDFENYCTMPQSREAMLERIAGFEPAFEPGAKADYSNSNYLLLGYIIEDITKQPYKEALQQRILKKVGLQNTVYSPAINTANKEAYSYIFDGGQWVKVDEWHESVSYAAGALQATPSDLTKFARALFQGKIIKKESLDEMTKIEMGYGKGVFQFPFGERRFYGHTGGIEAFAASLGYYPADEMGVAVIINGDNYDYNEIMIGILSIYYKLPYPFPNLKTVAVDPAILKTYEGTYSSPSIPLKINIMLEGSTLMAQATGQGSFPLNPLSNTEFNFEPARINMVFKENGFTFKQGGMEMEFTREK